MASAGGSQLDHLVDESSIYVLPQHRVALVALLDAMHDIVVVDRLAPARDLRRPTPDAIVREAKGRIYPAKDARMPRDLFEAGYPRLKEFLEYRDPGISSAMSRRLMGS